MTDYRLDHVGIGVRDLGAQISFYRDQLGFTEERRFDLPEAGLRIVVMNGPDGSRIELLAPSTSLPADGPARAGTKHVCFVVDDLDAVQNDLRSRGAAILYDIQTVAEAGVRNLWIVDAEDNYIEFIQPLV